MNHDDSFAMSPRNANHFLRCSLTLEVQGAFNCEIECLRLDTIEKAKAQSHNAPDS